MTVTSILRAASRRTTWVAAVLAGSATSLAAQPTMSLGERRLQVSTEECVRRADAALRVEGFSVDEKTASFAHGAKGVHGAYILCHPAADGATWANIVVASVNATETDLPGFERVRLLERMDQGVTGDVSPPRPVAPPTSSPAPAAAAGEVSAQWRVSSGDGWTSVWTRRGTSDLWDAPWINGDRRLNTVMRGGIDGLRVLFKRTKSDDGFLCEYLGTLSPDGTTATGIQRCPGVKDEAWKATIVKAKP